jgi:hypothetical protein
MVIKNLLGVKQLGKYFTFILIIYITDLYPFQTPSVFYNTLSAITPHCAATPTSSPSNPYRVINTHVSYPYSHSQPICSGSISCCPSPNVDFKSTFCNSYFPATTLWLWVGTRRYHRRLGMAFICLGQLGHCRNVGHLALELDCRKGNNEDDMFKCRWCLVFR